MKIQSIHAQEILDSRGNPTVEANIELENGTVYRHQTSDPMIPFERVSNIILHNK